jgi:hypothetical protein
LWKALARLQVLPLYLVLPTMPSDMFSLVAELWPRSMTALQEISALQIFISLADFQSRL